MREESSKNVDCSKDTHLQSTTSTTSRSPYGLPILFTPKRLRYEEVTDLAHTLGPYQFGRIDWSFLTMWRISGLSSDMAGQLSSSSTQMLLFQTFTGFWACLSRAIDVFLLSHWGRPREPQLHGLAAGRSHTNIPGGGLVVWRPKRLLG